MYSKSIDSDIDIIAHKDEYEIILNRWRENLNKKYGKNYKGKINVRKKKVKSENKSKRKRKELTLTNEKIYSKLSNECVDFFLRK